MPKFIINYLKFQIWQIRYQIEANVVSFLFSAFIMHSNHFNLMFTCNSYNSLISHMGNSQMQFKLLLGPFKIASHVLQFILMHPLTCHASSHVCALCHGIDCPSLFRCLFASSRIDDDVETDEVYDSTSVDFISTPGC